MRAMVHKFEPFTNKGQNAARLDSGFPPSSPVILCLAASVSGLNRICCLRKLCVGATSHGGNARR